MRLLAYHKMSGAKYEALGLGNRLLWVLLTVKGLADAVALLCMQFITGEVELNDTNWADYLAKWQSMGGSDILASYVKAYNEVNGTSLVPAL